jgi:uncharacterized Zn finger protein (UPF0148 family)
MIKRLFEKLFGLEPSVCPVCEVLRQQLDESSRERKELLQRALAPPIQPTETVSTEEFQPIKPQFTPWRVRQQYLEAEDRQKAKLMHDKVKEIEDLEKEVGLGASQK